MSVDVGAVDSHPNAETEATRFDAARACADHARADRAWFLAVALLCACASSVACSPRYEGPYPHVILISLDTTRADHLACYASPLVKTPAIDRLAREGVMFASAMAAAPTTLADHA